VRLAQRQCVRAVRGSGVRLLVIADGDRDDQTSELLCGADDFVIRPVREADLIARVRALLARGRDTRAADDWQERLAGQTMALLSLADLISALSASETLEGVLGPVVDCATGLVNSGEAAVLLLDAGRKELVVAGVSADHSCLRRGQRLALDHGVAGRVFTSGEVVAGVQQVGAAREGGAGAWPGEGSFACVPLMTTGGGGVSECVGVLGLSGRDKDEEYTQVDLEYLQMVGHLAAAAVRSLAVRYWRDQMRDSLTLALVSLTELRDNDTGRHLDRVTTFSVVLAEELRDRFGVREVDETYMRELRRAVPLHDIGKVAIPDHILLKPGRLTREEMDVMKTHTSIGADTVRSVRARLPDSTFAQMAEDIARYHHEWYDGSGYREGRAGDAIPMAARIVALADVYDALTTERVYKPARLHDEAVATIAALIGKQFDPLVGQAFLNCQCQFACYAKLLVDDGDAELAVDPERIPEGTLLDAVPFLSPESAGVLQLFG